MGIMDDVTGAMRRGTSAAERTARSTKLKADLREVNKRRQNLAAQLGASLYDATREDAAFREGRGELYRGIAQCDDERDQISRALQALQDAAAAEEAARQSFTCAVCGAQVRGGDLFCSGCGTPAEQARAVQPSCATADAGLRCATCGAPLKADYAFCMECGTPVQLAPEADGSAADEPDGAWADEPAIAAPQCPMCGAAAEEGQAFCMQCGASLARSE